MMEPLNRRNVLMGLTASSAGLGSLIHLITTASAGEDALGAPKFSPDNVNLMAQKLAQQPFDDRQISLAGAWAKITYDEYRDIRFRSDKAIWRGTDSPFQLQLFAPGWLFNRPLDIFVVENGRQRALDFSSRYFDFGKVVSASRPDFVGEDTGGQAPDVTSNSHPRRRNSSGEHDRGLTFSGFRIHGHINSPTYQDEFAVFQGASYFRATGRQQSYGLSARGLAINTARPGGEEFPYFRAFWIEKPDNGASGIVVHALLDSPSLAGAYLFMIQPGAETVMDVDLTLYPRKEVRNIGIAPLTSMFLFGEADRTRFDDFRSAVHDSEGLRILNGNREWLWRPLSNPRRLQSSAFMDENPRGFGLIQRSRDFSHFEDLEARYEKRPSLWIEPKGDWGKGEIELIEIPTKEEIHDNIVAFWKPHRAVKPGVPVTYSYRMYWGAQPAGHHPGAVVLRTLTGNKADGQRLFAVDFQVNGFLDGDLPTVSATSSSGKISNTAVQRKPAANELRASFVLSTEDIEVVDLRLSLERSGKTISEVWMYRWTRS